MLDVVVVDADDEAFKSIACCCTELAGCGVKILALITPLLIASLIEKDSLVNDGKNKNAIYVKSKFKEENNNNDII